MAKSKVLPSAEYLRKRLRYEPETGKLFWLDYEGMPQRWRTRWVGKEAFTHVKSHGYRVGRIDNILFRAHRIAWVLFYGESPSDQIDHINGVRTDNRIVNLRVVTCQENQRNAALSKNSSSGVNGVSWHKRDGKWQARVIVGGKYIHLGYFDTLEEAAIARAEASRLYGFTERHGLPLNVGEACD